MIQYKITASYRWAVDYDYDTVRNCHEGCDPICRCSTIENAAISEVCDIPELSIKVNSGRNGNFINYKLSGIERYCIDRIAVMCGIYDVGNYELVISNGYYGQEIEQVIFERDTEFKEHINNMLLIDNNYSKTLYVLNMEYSFIPDSLSNNTHSADIVTLRLSEVDHDLFKDGFVRKDNTSYFKEVDTNIPIGIVRDNRLVDGNNRFLHLLERCGAKSTRKFKFINLS